jgi:hypothetical protein
MSVTECGIAMQCTVLFCTDGHHVPVRTSIDAAWSTEDLGPGSIVNEGVVTRRHGCQLTPTADP